MKREFATIALTVLVAGCASQSRQVDRPIGISTGINGLQQSVCNCGGLQPRAEVQARQKQAELAQRKKSKALLRAH